jgi:membrane protease YdiL (CAAX protease family)
MRLRIVAGCLLGAAAVAAAGPPSWLPWGGLVRAHMPAWWTLPVLASAMMLAGAACLPGRLQPGDPAQPGPADPWPTVHRADAVALGLGLLLLLEPLLHLAVLGYLTRFSAPGADDVLLPGPVGTDPSALALRIGVLCILAPVAEELFFRGRLLPWLAGRIGPWAALSCTSLAFAVAHGSPITCLVAAPIGFLLGWLRLHRRDLGACVLVHQAHNGLFILAGPSLVTAPVSAAVLAIGGALMLTLATAHTRLGWRSIPAGLGLAAMLAVAVPPMLMLKDRWWSDGLAHLAARQRSNPEMLVHRLDAQRRRGRLTEARATLLLQRLQSVDSDAGRALRLLLDGASAQAADLDEAFADLMAAARVSDPPTTLANAAGSIGVQWPQALAALADEDPALVAIWLGPDGAARAISAANTRERKHLLAALERVWPGRLASVLLALPPEAVTPIERRHLRMHYADADDLIQALDEPRRSAWLGP